MEKLQLQSCVTKRWAKKSPQHKEARAESFQIGRDLKEQSQYCSATLRPDDIGAANRLFLLF
ncbi:MAG: hypothetical protein V4476_20390 [Pseudomonadota bacterium]